MIVRVLRVFARLGIAPCIACAMLSPAAAQVCPMEWLPGRGTQLTFGSPGAAVLYDPDGAGPRPTGLAVAGIRVPGLPNDPVLLLEGTEWTTLGPNAGVGGEYFRPLSMAVYNGELYVGGQFELNVSGQAINAIMRWNGTQWRNVAGGMGPLPASPTQPVTVEAMEVFSGQLYVGGKFGSAGGVSAIQLARWNGTTWSAPGNVVGAGSGGAVINALHSFNGSLWVGGVFTSVGGVAAQNLARFSGSAWFQAGQPNGEVASLASFSPISIPARRLYAAGSFTSFGAVPARFAAIFDPNVSQWSALGSTPVDASRALRVTVRTTGLSSARPAVVFNFPGSGFFDGTRQPWEWTGSAWQTIGPLSALPPTVGEPVLFTTYLGQYVMGNGPSGGSSSARGAIVRYNGSFWLGLGEGTPAPISALAADGTTVVGGFTQIMGDNRGAVARSASDNPSWSIVASPLDANDLFNFCSSGGGFRVSDVFVESPGQYLAIGRFQQQTGVGPVESIVRSTAGGAWQSLGSLPVSCENLMKSIARLPNGDLLAGGSFFDTINLRTGVVYRWNGGPNWVELSGPGAASARRLNGDILKVLPLPDGTFLVGGEFTTTRLGTPALSRVARWNGTAFEGLGAGVTGQVVRTMIRLGDGSVVVGGAFDFAGGVPSQSVARWTGSAWQAMGAGATGLDSSADVFALAALPDGTIVAIGRITSAGGQPANGIARWTGAAWEPIGLGLGYDPGAPAPSLFALTVTSDGVLHVGGQFITAGGNTSVFAARARVTPCPICDSLDFNQDGDFPTPLDIEDFIAAVAGNLCTTCSTDLDFNNDGDFPTPLDIEAFISVNAGGPCL